MQLEKVKPFGNTRFMPVKPDAKMIRILTDSNVPFVHRRRIDGNGYEVMKLLNKDWRTTISDEQKRISRHKTAAAAQNRFNVEVAKWRYEQLIKLGG